MLLTTAIDSLHSKANLAVSRTKFALCNVFETFVSILEFVYSQSISHPSPEPRKIATTFTTVPSPGTAIPPCKCQWIQPSALSHANTEMILNQRLVAVSLRKNGIPQNTPDKTLGYMAFPCQQQFTTEDVLDRPKAARKVAPIGVEHRPQDYGERGRHASPVG